MIITAATKPVHSEVNAEGSAAPGSNMHALITRLYPICRSITGNGVRETLGILQEQIPIEIQEVPSGTKVFRLERAARVEHSRRLDKECGRRTNCRLQEA